MARCRAKSKRRQEMPNRDDSSVFPGSFQSLGCCQCLNQDGTLQVGDAKQTGGAKFGEAGATGGGALEEREREEARRQREAEFDEQLRARAVRADMLGQDRHFRRYWWLQGAPLPQHYNTLSGGNLMQASMSFSLDILH